MKDTYGLGLSAYQKGNRNAKFIIESDIAETEEWPVATFFHTYNEMGEIERRALSMCTGRILDVGAGSGCHTLWLQEHGADAEALDISALATEVMKAQGVRKATCKDFFSLCPVEKYDTLLFLMNGAGICGTLDKLDSFFAFAKTLLTPEGQMLMDSADLIYLYEEEDGSYSIPLNQYYGEIEYTIGFDNQRGEPFRWLFVDFPNLQTSAERAGLKCEKVYVGDNFDYLARITLK